MNEKEMVFLGLFEGISKKSGKKFYMVYFYSLVETSNTFGYKPYQFFIPEIEVNKFKADDVLKKFIVQYVYANGQYVYVSSKRA